MAFNNDPDFKAALESFLPFIIKTADESKASDVVVADDADLIFPLEANTLYQFTLVIFYQRDTTGGGNPNIACRMNGSGGLTFSDVVYYIDMQDGSDGVVLQDLTTDSDFTAVPGVFKSLTIHGTISTIVAGNIAFAWAQSTSKTRPIIVRQGSFGKLRKV